MQTVPQSSQTAGDPMGAAHCGELAQRGWTAIASEQEDERELRNKLLAIGNWLADDMQTKVVSEPQVLRPTRSHAAKPSSLSAKFSTGAFPFHTDTAHWSIPARYLLLACENPGAGSRSTMLLDFHKTPISKSDLTLLYSEPFRVVNGRYSFFSTILRRSSPFVRYDPGCMHPMSIAANRIALSFSSQLALEQAHSISWKRGLVLVIDNWRLLHGRSGAVVEDGSRTLMRVYVGGSQ